MSLEAGNFEMSEIEFADTMAHAMETEFENAWNAVYNTALPEGGQRERRIFFVAIARGILRYLKEKEDANTHLFNNIKLSSGVPSSDGTGWIYGVQELEWNLSIIEFP